MQNVNEPSNVPHDIRRVSRLLDNQFHIGKFRFGLDPILGLVPGVGDFLSLLISGGLIALAAKRGVSRKLLMLMSINVFLDAVIGSIPIIGHIFDFLYKANARNVRMLDKYYNQGKYRGSGKGLAVAVIAILIVLIVFFVFLVWQFFEWFFTEVV